ncbi:MAG: DUF4384 domain-containing protein [Spirochaetaceae bacterium]|nr:DUF4384 domain-containing protein [Spirochaetaceae bacterium]
MRKITAILALVLAASALGAQAWDSDLPSSLDKIAEKSFQPVLLTAFGYFTYAESSLPSPFSRWLEERLADSISRTSRLRYLNRAAASTMDPAFEEIYGDLFENAAPDALLAGRYYDEGEFVRTRLELTSLVDGTFLGSADLRLRKDALPPSLAVDPSAAAMAPAASLAKLASGPGGGNLKATVATMSLGPDPDDARGLAIEQKDRGTGSVYREGELIRVLVTVNADAYVKVYHVDAEGKVQLIWPNRFGGSGRIAAGEAVAIPGDGDEFKYKMVPPFGTEFIKVVVSTVPFADVEEDFSILRGSAPQAITRGLAIQGTGKSAGLSQVKAEFAEATTSYVIVPKE